LSGFAQEAQGVHSRDGNCGRDDDRRRIVPARMVVPMMTNNLPGVVTAATHGAVSSKTHFSWAAPLSSSQSVYYTSRQVLDMVPLTARHLQRWDEGALVSPRQEKRKRLYRPDQVFRIALYRELRERGFSLQKIRVIDRRLNRQNFTLPDESRRWLITDGERVLLLADAPEVLGFLEQRRPVGFVLISLTAITERLECAVERQQPSPRREPARQTLDAWREQRMGVRTELRA
jgi:DNA-binding transcriptional MerR regulator